MEILNLRENNLKDISCSLSNQQSIGIGGLSGSGKSTFCLAIAQESFRRIATLLTKSEYRFLFSEKLESNCFSWGITGMPLVFYLRKTGSAANPRSTLGTHSGLFKKIRQSFAHEHGKSSEFFSFNNSIMWCPSCKGRGSTANVKCNKCGGTRYNPEILQYTLPLNGSPYIIVDLNRMPISELSSLSDAIGLDEVDKKIICNLIDLGLPYLSLERIMSTLSGGETMRVLLSEFMAKCSGSLLILDEVSTGLDQRSLATMLANIRNLGLDNQIWFIDHSDTVLSSTEDNLYFGPGSGDLGGQIVTKSPRPAAITPEHPDFQPEEFYEFKDLSKRNIQIAELSLPKNCMIAITGESGCGKSTLVHDCILPAFTKRYSKAKAVVIGQDRNQSITSKSTIATFLSIKKYTTLAGEDFETLSLEAAITQAKKDKNVVPVLTPLVEMGLGYLTLDRRIQTLSTGEFQSIHLISSLQTKNLGATLIVLDEPSKGLSQNILNLFMKKLRDLQVKLPITVLIIEHNEFVIRCCDLVFDFGKRKEGLISNVPCLPVDEWVEGSAHLKGKPPVVTSKIQSPKNGVTTITDDVDKTFDYYDTIFKGGIIKNYSSTAQWIYKDVTADEIKPFISIDFEGKLYSNHTFLFELASTINSVLTKSDAHHLQSFDFYNQDNLCDCCNGTGGVLTFDFQSIISNTNVGFWDGLLHSDIMKELKRFNYSKIKFLFKEIKKESKLQLDKPFSKMSDEEKTVFLYGYWDNTFYDPAKKAQRRWRGLLQLVNKYMLSSTSPLKQAIKDSGDTITCPICKGYLLKHKPKLQIRGMELQAILSSTIGRLTEDFPDIPQLGDFEEILGDDITLNTDVSTLPAEQQVLLECLEIYYARFYGFTFAFKNLAPFYKQACHYVDQIALQNQVVLLDWDGAVETKEQILSRLAKENKLKPEAYCYDLIGMKKIVTAINAVRKKSPCPYCNGRKVLRDESIFEGVDVTETPCTACNQTGISKAGLASDVMNHPVSLWLYGHLDDVKKDIPQVLHKIPLCARVRDLNKRQLYSVMNYLEGNKC